MACIAINFGMIKSGGANTVALNFVSSLDSSSNVVLLVVAKHTPLDALIKNGNFNKYRILRVSKNPLLRSIQEAIFLSFLLKFYRVNILYNYFGGDFAISKAKRFTNSADSNLYFPKVDFWQEYPLYLKLVYQLRDLYRKMVVKRAYMVFYENEYIYNLSKLNLRKGKRAKYIAPSISKEPVSFRPLNLSLKKRTGLFICGWQKNKGYLMIPKIIKSFEELGVYYRVVFTAPLKKNSIDYLEFKRLCIELKVWTKVEMSGQVPHSQIRELYGKVDDVYVISKLESFSNTWIEAWKYRCLLVVNDSNMNRQVLGGSALYVERENATKIARTIYQTIQSGGYKSIVGSYKEKLLTYNTPFSKYKVEMDALKIP